MINSTSLRAGHPPTLFARCFHLALWSGFCSLGAPIAPGLHRDTAKQALTIAVPMLAAARPAVARI